MAANTSTAELNGLLKEVSRSFYLTLRILPGAIRPQIGLAYLLARATDTIADTEIVPVTGRLEALGRLRDRILGLSHARLDFHRWAMRQAEPKVVSPAASSPSSPKARTSRSPGPPQRTVAGQGGEAERRLLERLEEALRCLERLSTEDRERIRDVLTVITRGQELDLQRFGAASRDNVLALENEEELLDYTYKVAGCVGEFWTRMCRAHLFPNHPIDVAGLLSQGVRFGQGLQLVNILRDLPADLRMGRCYLPRKSLQELGLNPADLLDAKNESSLRPLYDQWLDRADSFLAEGWKYTCALPRGCRRVRLACAWPALIGVQTLRRLRFPGILDPAQRIKISRREVRGILVGTFVRWPWSTWWRRLYEDTRGRG